MWFSKYLISQKIRKHCSKRNNFLFIYFGPVYSYVSSITLENQDDVVLYENNYLRNALIFIW